MTENSLEKVEVDASEITLADVHALVLSIRADVDALKDNAAPVLQKVSTVMDAVRERGIMAAFSGGL